MEDTKRFEDFWEKNVGKNAALKDKLKFEAFFQSELKRERERLAEKIKRLPIYLEERGIGKINMLKRDEVINLLTK